MATQIIVRREFAGLVAVTAHDAELLSEIPLGREFTATLTQQRSIRQQRFYWALLGKVVANHPFYRRGEPLHIWLKTRLGYVEEIHFHDGEVQMRTTSTAFDKMDGLEMRKFMDAAIDVICTEVLPGVRRRDMLAEVERMLGVRFDDVFASGEEKERAA